MKEFRGGLGKRSQGILRYNVHRNIISQGGVQEGKSNNWAIAKEKWCKGVVTERNKQSTM